MVLWQFWRDKNAVFYSICIHSLALGKENHVFSCLCCLLFEELMLGVTRLKNKQMTGRAGGEALLVCADVVLFLFLGGDRRDE